MGLNVIAFEPDNIAMARAFVAPDAKAPQLVLDIGSNNTDIVVVMNGAPRLTRALGTGTATMIRAVAQNLVLDEPKAADLIFKFGMSRDRIEGQIYNAVINTVDLLANDIEKSIKFFGTRYRNMPMDRIIVSGAASLIPEFANYIANKLSMSVEIGNAWRNVSFSSDRQTELSPLAHSFGVAAGLAERQE